MKLAYELTSSAEKKTFDVATRSYGRLLGMHLIEKARLFRPHEPMETVVLRRDKGGSEAFLADLANPEVPIAV